MILHALFFWNNEELWHKDILGQPPNAYLFHKYSKPLYIAH